MKRGQNESLFFLNNDREVNRLVFKIGGVFMIALLGMLAAACVDLFKIEPRDVLAVICLLALVEAIFFVLLKLGAPVNVVKLYGLLAMEFCVCVMVANPYFGIYITYVLVPAISCLYFDHRLTRRMIFICYAGMMVGLWVRAPGAIVLAFPGYTRTSWFIAFGLGYTLEYAALSAVLTAVARRARRYMETLYQHNKMISDIQSKIIFRFADLVESRDDSTGKHVKRTSRYVVMIAERLMREGKYAELLDEDDVVNIGLAAPLHDIGKIKIPDAILRKPGKLTPEEFEIIKTHTREGQAIIDSTMDGIEREEFVAMARDMALSHHEKWDGSGYPRGLSGDGISLPARIMAIADVFDALISDRCYKRAVSVREAFEVLRETSGTHFDPYLVEVFISAEDEIRRIIDEQ